MQAVAGSITTLDEGDGAASNGLLANLIAYWAFDEAGGANNALDKHTNGLTLTQVGSPGAGTGKVYASARTFNGSSQVFDRASQTLLQGGDNDMTWAAWVNLAAKPALAPIIAKYDLVTDAAREYILHYSNGAKRFRLSAASGVAGGEFAAVANTFGEPSLNTWYFVMAWHDAVANTINISVNNGATDSTAFTTGMSANSEGFAIGGLADRGYYFNGQIGPAMIWKSTPGNGGVLTAAQRTLLYNAGAGLAYSAFS